METEKSVLSEYTESPIAGMAQGFNTPSPTEPIPARALPQAGVVRDEEEAKQPGAEELIGLAENVAQVFTGAAGALMGGMDSKSTAVADSMEALPTSESPMSIFTQKFGGR